VSTDGTDGPAVSAETPRRPDPRNMPRRAVLVARPVGVPAPGEAQQPDGDTTAPRP